MVPAKFSNSTWVCVGVAGPGASGGEGRLGGGGRGAQQPRPRGGGGRGAGGGLLGGSAMTLYFDFFSVHDGFNVVCIQGFIPEKN